MNLQDAPLVSVLTPVYNGAEFLEECIESVLKQTYGNYEYIIINNRSTDRTLEIARQYAKKDSRIRVHDNTDFVAVIANHNIAFGLISPAAMYCKVVSADDFIFPECLERMVEFGEAHPSVGIIGSYQLSGDRIRWQGLEYPKAVLTGVEMSRRVFLGGDKTFGFGSPTSILYRADLVRETAEFYPNASPHSDTSACFRCLQKSDFGFIYQVLSFEKMHAETQSSASAKLNRYSSANLNDVVCYGPSFLNPAEMKQKLDETLEDYHRFLAVNYFVGFRDKEFWKYHKSRLEELGYPLRRGSLLKAAARTVFREAMNPARAIGKVWKHVFPGSAKAPARVAQPAPGDRKTLAGC
jgi:glycosyltransferase involved in cell wall biosynthesis